MKVPVIVKDKRGFRHGILIAQTLTDFHVIIRSTTFKGKGINQQTNLQLFTFPTINFTLHMKEYKGMLVENKTN